MFREIKPTFGGGGFSSGATSTPFGQTPFGKPTSSGFTAPAFGSATTSLFGSNPSTSGSVFGGATTTPVFGQAQTTQSTGFGFGVGTGAASNPFGAPQTSTGSGLFGAPTTSAFGQNKPSAFGGFGGTQTGGLFGQTQPSLFSQTSTAGSSLFNSPFGNANTGSGTVVKFTPFTSTDTMLKGGVTQTINTRHYCITFMKEYENKSLEELRYEDYLAGRKGPQQAQTSGLFQQPGAWASTSTGTGTGLFGNTENKSLFSAPNTGFPSTGVFGSQPQQTNSIFGKPAFGAATTSATGFGFNSTPTTNIFGSQQKPFGTAAPQTPSLFGTPTSQAPSAFATSSSPFSAFGGQQNATQNIGLFGPKTPFSTTTTTPAFGSFGAHSTNTTNVFNQKPAFGTGGGFGTQTSVGGFGGGLFSTAQNNTGPFSSAFKPQFSFNQPTTSTTSAIGGGLSLGGGSSLFAPAKPNNIFGANTIGSFGTSGFATTGGLGTLGGGLGNPLLGSSLTGNATNPVNQEFPSLNDKIQALAQMPYGSQPLFRNSLQITGKTDELLKPVKHNPEREAQFNQYKVGATQKLKVRPWGHSKKSLFEGLNDAQYTFTLRPSPKQLQLNEKLLETQVSASEQALLLDPDKENNNRLVNSKENISPELPNNNTSNKESTSNSGRNAGEVENIQRAVLEPVRARLQQSHFSGDEISISESFEKSEEPGPKPTGPPHPTGIILTRAGYYTIPSLNELASCVEPDGSCIVDNFTVGREGYGNVFFPDEMNIAGLNLDEIVHFRHKEVLLYPDESIKPPSGEGLNRRAQITLDRVWPQDKTTHEPICDPDTLTTLGFEDKLRRVCARMNARFLEYRPQTGSWVFKVDGF